jgi:putative endonuclease
MSQRSKGLEGESLAAAYLEQQGYRILERNFRFGHGEVDLIARDGDELVFVEVKTRHGENFGTPEEAMTPKKEALMKKVAEGYLHVHRIDQQACRFDVVAITFAEGEPRIRLIRDAFL